MQIEILAQRHQLRVLQRRANKRAGREPQTVALGVTFANLAAGALGWMLAAGVDTAVDATPRNWLTAPTIAVEPQKAATAQVFGLKGSVLSVISVIIPSVP